MVLPVFSEQNHGPGNEGIFDLIRTWFADENYVQQEQGKINYEAKQSSFN